MQATQDAFAGSRKLFETVLDYLRGDEARGLTHSELEDSLGSRARELVCQLYQDHLDLRAAREARCEQVADTDGVAHRSIEAGHTRPLVTVFGEVEVERLAYRSKAAQNLYLADAALNLPAERHSHGLRRLAALESARGSFADAQQAISRATGVQLGKRQVEQLAQRAAVDFADFYARCKDRPPGGEDDVVVLSVDGKGIVMRPDALRPATKKAAASSARKLETRLSKGEKRNRKRIAEVGSVYELTPVARAASDIIGSADHQRAPGPKTTNKWLTASVVQDAAQVVSDTFDEAERRDPAHNRTWVALVDGNAHQIDRIRAEAKARGITVSIICDFVHVLEYLWKAAWCFFDEGDTTAEAWVHNKALAVLEGDASTVAAAIRRSATRRGLNGQRRKTADTCADYLLHKRPHLDYPTALASGWPIATGIIEGACRHLVKDRLDLTGARWGLDGAEAILKLRALSSNGDFELYWAFHLSQERKRTHAARYADGIIPKAG